MCNQRLLGVFCYFITSASSELAASTRHLLKISKSARRVLVTIKYINMYCLILFLLSSSSTLIIIFQIVSNHHQPPLKITTIKWQKQQHNTTTSSWLLEKHFRQLSRSMVKRNIILHFILFEWVLVSNEYESSTRY